MAACIPRLPVIRITCEYAFFPQFIRVVAALLRISCFWSCLGPYVARRNQKTMGNVRRAKQEVETVRWGALRGILNATGGSAKVRELYQLLTAAQAAEFLGVSLSYIQHGTGRGELPCVRIGKGDPRYRVIDLISWQERRLD